MIFKLTDEQEAIVQTVASGQSVLVNAYAGSSKCVDGRTLVSTNLGRVRISSLIREEGYRPYEGQLKLRTRDGWETPSHTYKKEADTVTVTSSRGYAITCTHNHPLWVMDSNGLFIWKNAGQLTTLDSICISLTDAFDRNEPRLPSVDYRNRLKPNEHLQLPPKMSSALAYYLGYYLSEGSLSGAGASLTFWNNDPFLRRHYVKVAEELFPFIVGKVKNYEQDGLLAGKVQFHSRTVGAFLSSLGVKFTHSRDVTIPNCIRQASLKSKRAFIRAYYSGDGGWLNSGINLVSASEMLIRQMQILLLDFGVVSYRSNGAVVNDVNYYVLHISGEHVDTYMQNIGFSHRRKEEEHFLRKPSHRNTNIRVINAGLEKRIRDTANISPVCNNGVEVFDSDGARRSIRVKSWLTKNYKSAKWWHAWSLSADAGLLAVNHAAFRRLVGDMSWLDTSEYYWDQVSSVTPSGKRWVYDFTLPRDHSFVGNGIICHNTTTLVAAARALSQRDPSSKKLAVAFNVRIKDELVERLRDTNWEVRTFNSLGFGTLMSNKSLWNGGRGFELTENKDELIAAEIMAMPNVQRWMSKNRVPHTFVDALKDLYNKARVFGYRADAINESVVAALSSEMSGYDVTSRSLDVVDKGTKTVLSGLTKMVRGALHMSLDAARNHGIIDFNDQVYLAMLYCPHHGRSWDVVLVDEVQDASALNHMQVLRACRRQLGALGDVFQTLYFFRGALEDGMEVLADAWKKKSGTDMTRLKLSMTFRCPHAVVARQEFTVGIKDYKAAPTAPVGTLFMPVISDQGQDAGCWEFNSILDRSEDRDVPETSVVLSATNAPLYVAMGLLWRDLNCKCPEDFLTWIRLQVEPPHIRTLNKASHHSVLRSKKTKKNPTLTSLHYLLNATGMHASELKALFHAKPAPDAPLTLSTVHRFKGLEATNAYLLEPDLMGDRGNIRYVAETRARKFLGSMFLCMHVRSRTPADYFQRYLTAVGRGEVSKEPASRVLGWVVDSVLESHPGGVTSIVTQSKAEVRAEAERLRSELLACDPATFDPTGYLTARYPSAHPVHGPRGEELRVLGPGGDEGAGKARRKPR